jgi:multisubunit Na+/H+ antiporter MnhG subunit
MDIVEVGAIVIICNFAGMVLKKIKRFDNKNIPEACGVLGALLGVVAMAVMPGFPADEIISALALGIMSGLASVGAHQIGKNRCKNGIDKGGEG